MGLTREEWEQVEQIVDEAMTLDHARRNGYVRQQCAGDELLYSRVTEMLESIEKSEGFLEDSSDYKEPLIESFLDEAEQTQSSLIGEELGSYKIVELIGHGGMGSVYLAERSDDTFDQKVALKVIRRGMDTPSIVGRFKREQQILARLTHPNIAHLYNGGISRDGLPYLIMEYVDGCPIDEYCDRKKLTLDERLNLFQTVLKAVQHAHNNLIVHRDLKPDNILVTDEGVVKILDFGIAKLLEDDPDLRTMFQTRRQTRILSLGYAAPEQLEQEHVTTTTDTYALGILLYQLLCGKHPYEMNGKKLTELEELIQTVTPPPPSARMHNLSSGQQSDIARKRSGSPRKLVKALRGDLDAIIMKALRKRSDMRYLSAGEFIEEIDRYCSGLPVNAREGTLRYHAAKFFNRHRKKMSVAAAMLVLTFSFFAFYSYRMTQERNNAEQQAAKAEQISGFIIDIFESNYPENARGDTVPVQDVLREGLKSVESLNEQPLVQAEMYSVIGNIFRHMGSYDEASDALETSIDLYESHLGEPSDDLANAYRNMGTLERDHGSLEEADKFLSRSLLFRETSDDTLFAYDLTMTANVVRQLDQQEKAREMLTQAIDIQRKYYGENNVKLAETIFNLGLTHKSLGEYENAERNYSEALSILENRLEGPHPGKAAVMGELGTIYKYFGELEKSETFYRRDLEMDLELYGDNHIYTAGSYGNLAHLLQEKGELAEAERINKQALKIFRDNLPADHHDIGTSLNNLAQIYEGQKKYEAADSLYRKALQIKEKDLGKDHSSVAKTLHNRGRLFENTGREEMAADLYEKALAIRKRALGKTHPEYEATYNSLLNLYRENDDIVKADSLLKDKS